MALKTYLLENLVNETERQKELEALKTERKRVQEELETRHAKELEAKEAALLGLW